MSFFPDNFENDAIGTTREDYLLYTNRCQKLAEVSGVGAHRVVTRRPLLLQ
jgi:hypothetical protein